VCSVVVAICSICDAGHERVCLRVCVLLFLLTLNIRGEIESVEWKNRITRLCVFHYKFFYPPSMFSDIRRLLKDFFSLTVTIHC
jgi:hypothetical protein